MFFKTLLVVLGNYMKTLNCGSNFIYIIHGEKNVLTIKYGGFLGV